MIKEIKDIVTAFKAAQCEGHRTALATVVHVEGSSYRRPGARMLVEDNGRLTGAISGGCLEGDALRKALLAISQQQNKLVTYNTLDPDDVQFGVQLGCNGIVHILFEPIDAAQANNPVTLLEKTLSERKDTVLATLFSLHNYQGHQPGTCLFFDGFQTHTNLADERLIERLKEDAATALEEGASFLKQYEESETSTFIELLQPPVSLIVIGAGNDALPLVAMAGVLGWQTTIVDGRSTHASQQRFPKAHQIVVGKGSDAMKQIVTDERTAVVLMTHNYNYDLEILPSLLQTSCRYVGILGPKKRLERLMTELEGITITELQKAKLYGPTGLDIGAETAEEIALSILAEIKAALARRSGGSLRHRPEPIHERSISTKAAIK